MGLGCHAGLYQQASREAHRALPAGSHFHESVSERGGGEQRDAESPDPLLQWDFKNAVAQEWNFTIERQFGDWAGRVSYLGNQTHHIPYNGADVNRPWVQQPNVPIQNQRPYQPWGSINSFLSAGKQNFNQVQLGVQKRFSRGLSFQAEYQFTRSLDNIDNAGAPDNPGNWNLSYGNTVGVRRHWLVFNYVYELPFRGRNGLTK